MIFISFKQFHPNSKSTESTTSNHKKKKHMLLQRRYGIVATVTQKRANLELHRVGCLKHQPVADRTECLKEETVLFLFGTLSETSYENLLPLIDKR